MATIKQATSAVLDGIVVTVTASGVLTREVAGTSIDIVKGVRKPIKNSLDAVGTYSEILVQDANLSLEETKLMNGAKLKGLNKLSKDEAYLAEIEAQYIADLKGVSEDIKF